MAARVVLAGDSPDLRELLRLALELSGDFAVVAEAAVGEAAVRAVAEQQPDALLLDLSMPLLDGIEALPRSAAPRRTAASLTPLSFPSGTAVPDGGPAAWRRAHGGPVGDAWPVSHPRPPARPRSRPGRR